MASSPSPAAPGSQPDCDKGRRQKRPWSMDVYIDIIRDTSEPDGVRFEMNYNCRTVEELNFENNGRPGFWVHFHIDDDDGTGFVFPNEPEKALWVKPATADDPNPCPKSKHDWNEFTPHDVTNANRTLIVRNHNSRKQRFGFSLRFGRNPTEEPTVLFDPIGTNQNGQTF